MKRAIFSFIKDLLTPEEVKNRRRRNIDFEINHALRKRELLEESIRKKSEQDAINKATPKVNTSALSVRYCELVKEVDVKRRLRVSNQQWELHTQLVPEENKYLESIKAEQLKQYIAYANELKREFFVDDDLAKLVIEAEKKYIGVFYQSFSKSTKWYRSDHIYFIRIDNSALLEFASSKPLSSLFFYRDGIFISLDTSEVDKTTVSNSVISPESFPYPMTDDEDFRFCIERMEEEMKKRISFD